MAEAADYLVIGAGATGLAFTDALVGESDAEVVLVDRREGVGGHWRDSYPFVRLHTASTFYGVNSLRLGEDRITPDGHNAGYYEQASGAEVTQYFERVLSDRLLPTCRVRLLAQHEFLGNDEGLAQVRDCATGEVRTIHVRHRVVDARYQEASIPATHSPTFVVDPDAAFVPIGALPSAAQDHARYTVIGGGKTAADACLWLLDNAIDPDRIRWIRPREMWFTDRATMQPLDQIASLIGGIADEAEAGASASDLADLCHRLEDCGRFLRLDPSLEPTMYRGTMLSRSEATALRQVSDVVRLGHVRALHADRIVLDQGEIATGADVLHVDCSARGLAASPEKPIFAPGLLTLQQVRHNSPTFNAALLGFVEAHRDDDVTKNRLCPPNAYARTPADFARMLSRTWNTEASWQREPDIAAWVADSRLNLLKGVRDRRADAQVRHATGRFVTHVGEAVKRLPQLV
jgi:NAD(P)-binding Rossmann-like domain